MILLLQRVHSASVAIDQKPFSQIGKGLLVYVGFQADDKISECKNLAEKALKYRIFPDSDNKLNIGLLEDETLSLMSISQFTLAADTKKGLRPSFGNSMKFTQAESFYHQINDLWAEIIGSRLKTGIFGAHMQVQSLNEGPINFLLEN